MYFFYICEKGIANLNLMKIFKIIFYCVELFLIVYNNFVINEWVCNCCLISYKVLINLGVVFCVCFWGCSCLFD